MYVGAGSDTNKAADAYFKLALCYKRLDQASEARQTFNRFIRDYPDHPNVQRAYNEMDTLP